MKSYSLALALVLLAAPTAWVQAEDGQPPADATEMPVVEVIGTPDEQKKIPGSAQVLTAETLQASHVMTTNEALRKAAGVNVRDEEGLGLRPNIGIRGLNPTRSTKVLLLEDGIPLAFAPYGDNASYYHPPVERFERIEILKGAGQNIYGPQSVAGVINYITPAPPAAFSGGLALTSGSRGYFNGHGTIGGAGMRLDYMRKEGDAARDNSHSELDDVSYKGVFALGAAQALTARASYYKEDSQLTYTGLTEAEYRNFGHEYNPFDNDTFVAHREGVSLTHEADLGAGRSLITNLYGSAFKRDWWRQSSTTTDGQCDSVTYDTSAGPNRTFQQARADGHAVNPDDCNANIGNLRQYYNYGVEPRLRVSHGLFGAASELETGVRMHFEEQDRLGKTGASFDARDGALDRESNERLNQAYSAFVQNRLVVGDLAVTPSLRVEHVRYERTNRLTGASGTDEITELIPSLGATYELGAATAFAGVHRGFAPPTTADLINDSGGSVDLDAEESWNYELGLRARPVAGVTVEGAAFLNDFRRQIAVGSIAGGSTPLATGETRYAGAELAAQVELGRLAPVGHTPFAELAWTWLPTADQETALLKVSDGTPVTGSVAGKRLPYAPKHLLTSTIGYRHSGGFEARLEAAYVGGQYSDFANTETAPADGNGQTGALASHTIWNAALSYRFLRTGLGVFLAAKNLADKEYIVDRTRGILPGIPRLVQTGINYTF